MTNEQILEAEKQANAFIEAIKMLRDNNPSNYGPCKFKANVRRKSMDLTRSLAAMRKSQW